MTAKRDRKGRPPGLDQASRLMAAAGARRYERKPDLPKLIPLWPSEVEDTSWVGTLRIPEALRRALRSERRRGIAGHWNYDLTRHLGLLSAYKGELGACLIRRRQSKRSTGLSLQRRGQRSASAAATRPHTGTDTAQQDRSKGSCRPGYPSGKEATATRTE
jgi:hypothetical protein